MVLATALLLEISVCVRKQETESDEISWTLGVFSVS
jgi:hypothetical protein